MRHRTAIILLVLIPRLLSFAGPVEKFEEGVRFFRKDNVDSAISSWQNALMLGGANGETFYNLGNAYYRQNKISAAILNYERAKKFLPRDHDVANNLEIARLAIVDKFETPLHLVVWDWIDQIRDFFNLSELAILFQITGGLALIAFTLWRFVPIRFQTLFQTACISFFVCYLVLGSWYLWRTVLDSRVFGIITVAKTDVHSAPDANSKQIFSLHEGTKVRLGENLSGWIRIQLADRRQGWLVYQDLEKI